jgi:hypothetical protein
VPVLVNSDPGASARGLYGEHSDPGASARGLYGEHSDPGASARGLYGEHSDPGASARGLYGEHSDPVTRFPPSTSIFPVSIISTLLHDPAPHPLALTMYYLTNGQRH